MKFHCKLQLLHISVQWEVVGNLTQIVTVQVPTLPRWAVSIAWMLTRPAQLQPKHTGLLSASLTYLHENSMSTCMQSLLHTPKIKTCCQLPDITANTLLTNRSWEQLGGSSSLPVACQAGSRAEAQIRQLHHHSRAWEMFGRKTRSCSHRAGCKHSTLSFPPSLPALQPQVVFPSLCPPPLALQRLLALLARLLGWMQSSVVAAVTNWLFPGWRKPSSGQTHCSLPKKTAQWKEGGTASLVFRRGVKGHRFLPFSHSFCAVSSLPCVPRALLHQRDPQHAAAPTAPSGAERLMRFSLQVRLRHSGQAVVFWVLILKTRSIPSLPTAAQPAVCPTTKPVQSKQLIPMWGRYKRGFASGSSAPAVLTAGQKGSSVPVIPISPRNAGDSGGKKPCPKAD